MYISLTLTHGAGSDESASHVALAPCVCGPAGWLAASLALQVCVFHSPSFSLAASLALEVLFMSHAKCISNVKMYMECGI